MNSYSNEQLGTLTDKELAQEFMTIRGKIYNAKKKKTNVRELEIYYCYIARELQSREDSKICQKK